MTTRALHRLRLAHRRLCAAEARKGEGRGTMRTLRSWCRAKFGVQAPEDLTGAQAREGARRLNAWRAGIEGRPGVKWP